MPERDTLSYFIGMSVGNSIKMQELGTNVDIETIAAAMKDVVSGHPTRLTDPQFKDVQKQLRSALQAKAAAQRQVEMAKMEKEGAENKAKGDAFMAKNATEPGIQTLTNGIQYKIIKEGTGVTPAAHDNVTVSYKGSLIDGTVFDQNTNFTTPVTGRTIKGWTEILQKMKVGSEWQVFIPPNFGYEKRGFPPKIGPNTTLIFDMAVLSDTPAPAGQSVSKPMSVTHSAGPPPTTVAAAPSSPPSPTTTPVVSGQIIKVPSAEELKNGAKIEVITNAPPLPQ
jgi:FKBP-type peptidyl-prolyl cis-trans isomerase FklB